VRASSIHSSRAFGSSSARRSAWCWGKADDPPAARAEVEATLLALLDGLRV